MTILWSNDNTVLPYIYSFCIYLPEKYFFNFYVDIIIETILIIV